MKCDGIIAERERNAEDTEVGDRSEQKLRAAEETGEHNTWICSMAKRVGSEELRIDRCENLCLVGVDEKMPMDCFLRTTR